MYLYYNNFLLSYTIIHTSFKTLFFYIFNRENTISLFSYKVHNNSLMPQISTNCGKQSTRERGRESRWTTRTLKFYSTTGSMQVTDTAMVDRLNQANH